MSRIWKGTSGVHKQALAALLGVFSNISYRDEEGKIIPVKCVYGGPERTVARITTEDNIILPIISIINRAREGSQTRRKFSPVLQENKYWSHRHQRAVRLVSLAPVAVDFNFEVNLWSKYVADINQITEQCRRLFNPALTLETPLNKHTQVFLSSEDNSYQTVLGDADARIMVKKLNIQVESYIPTPIFMITSTGKIEEFHGEIELRK